MVWRDFASLWTAGFAVASVVVVAVGLPQLGWGTFLKGLEAVFKQKTLYALVIKALTAIISIATGI